jgi:hypothetical protein
MSEQAITPVINLYCLALDSHSWDLFDEIFAPDVDLDYCHVLKWSDRASFKRQFAEMHEATAGHQHQLGVPQILVDGDRAWALTYGHFHLFNKSPAIAVGDLSEGGAWYDDELVLTAEGWRISKRVARNFWRAGAVAEDGPYKLIVDSFPEEARAGRVGFINALRQRAGAGAKITEPSA